MLVNELVSMADPLVVVVDDLPAITSEAAHAQLDHLIDRAPPAVHVVIATPVDPPLRTRAAAGCRQRTSYEMLPFDESRLRERATGGQGRGRAARQRSARPIATWADAAAAARNRVVGSSVEAPAGVDDPVPRRRSGVALEAFQPFARVVEGRILMAASVCSSSNSIASGALVEERKTAGFVVQQQC